MRVRFLRPEAESAASAGRFDPQHPRRATRLPRPAPRLLDRDLARRRSRAGLPGLPTPLTDTLLVRARVAGRGCFSTAAAARGEALSAIVADLCWPRRRLGLADPTGPSSPTFVPRLRDRPPDPRCAAHIEPAPPTLWFFDGGPRANDVLRFRKRAGPRFATLPAAGPRGRSTRSGPRPGAERRTQEVELPRAGLGPLQDKGADYQQGAQSDKRAALPVPTMHSRDQVRVDPPIALRRHHGQAHRKPDALTPAWIERSSYEGRVPWTWLLLEPTDRVWT